MPELHGKNLIGSQLSSEGSETFQAHDPSQGKAIDPPFFMATEDEVERSIRQSSKAAAAYRRVSAEQRANFLDRVADEILELGDSLIERAHAETALPTARLTGERGRTVGQIRMFAQIAREGSWVEASVDRAIPDREPVPKPDLRRMLIPLGPVAVFGASNFPLAFSAAGGDTASALAAGCPVIVKAHRAHPGTSELIGQAVLRAAEATDMPDGVFSLLHGTGRTVGLALVRHASIQALGFTGSTSGGRALFDESAKRPHPIPVYAEMGSINPVFVLPGALEERGGEIATGLQQSVTLGVGQFCTNPGLVLGLEGESLGTFLTKLGEEISLAPLGTMLHPGILESFDRGVDRFRAVDGVEEVGRASGDPDPGKTQVAAVALGTSGEVFVGRDELSDEIFGPATLVVRCENRDRLMEIARRLDGHLTATIHGTDEDLAAFSDLIAILETKVGRLLVNGFPTGVEVCASMQHGGPYPATTDSRSTSVGGAAITRFARPIAYQNFPQSALPPELRDENPREIWRKVDGEMTREPQT